MSREIRRVPLDFDAPLNKVWAGYLVPEKLRLADCAACNGRGYTPARQWVEALTRDLLMLDDDLRAQAQGRPLHPYLAGGGHYLNARPSADIAEFGTGLAGRESGFIGHDALDNWRATAKVIEAAGLDPKVWGMCTNCHDGRVEVYEGQRAEAEAWEPTQPPAGEGWQLWETTTEGSPVSPAFPDQAGLIDWLTSKEAYDGPVTREQAERFVNAGWAPTFIHTAATGLAKGIAMAPTQAPTEEPGAN